MSLYIIPTIYFSFQSNVTLQNRLQILHGGTIASMVDLGGSLAVASRGLFSTGVSTDLNGTSYSFPTAIQIKTNRY